VKPKLILIGVGAAIAVSAIWFFILWSPQSKSLTDARTEKAAAEQKASVLQARLGHLKKLEANKDVLERDRVKFATAIPSGDELDHFILSVNERASKAGVSFVSISPAPPANAAAAPGSTAPGAPTAIGLQMQVSGDYFAILRFLEQLRVDGERLVTVESLALAKGGGAGNPNDLSASIAGKMYTFTPPASVPAAASTPAN